MPENEELTSADAVTEKWEKKLSSDSEEVSEQLDIIKGGPEEQPETEEVKEQPLEEETVEEEVTKEEVKETPEEEKEEGLSFKADKQMVTPKDLTELKRYASMGYHAEQKLEGVNNRERAVQQLEQTYQQALRNIKSEPDVSKETPAIKEEELPPELVKQEITEYDEEDEANAKRRENARIDHVLRQDKKIEQLENMLYSQETNLYEAETHKQFDETEKLFKEETGIELPEDKKAKGKIKDSILMYYDRGQRILHNNPEWFDQNNWPRIYNMRHAFYEWLGTQISQPQTPQSFTVEEIKKNPKLYNDLKEQIYSEEAENKEKTEPIIQKKGKPPLKSEDEELEEAFKNREEGDSYSDAVTKRWNKKIRI